MMPCQPLWRPILVLFNFQIDCCELSKPRLPQEGTAAAISLTSAKLLRQLSLLFPKLASHHSPQVLVKIHLPTILLSPGSTFRSLKRKVDLILCLIYVVSTTPGAQRTYLHARIATWILSQSRLAVIQVHFIKLYLKRLIELGWFLFSAFFAW